MHRLRTSDDIRNLPGYVERVDPKLNPLNRIVSHYYIRPFEIKCGLCGKAHMDGCIVELASLQITNIGHICGKRFGDRFERERARNYEKEYKPRLIRAITQVQARLAADQFKLQEVSLQAKEIAERAAHFTEKYPELMGTLKRRAFANHSGVSESVARTKDEIDDMMAANRFQSREALTFKEKYVGAINAFRFPLHDLSSSTGLRKLFQDLGTFHELKPRALSMEHLQRWSNWAEDFDDNLRKTILAVEDGKRFFSPANFQLFALLTQSDTMKAELKTLQLHDIARPEPSSLHHHPEPAVATKAKQRRALSLRELRRLTGNKKGR